MNVFKIYFGSIYICSSLLVPVYAVILARVYQGSNFKFIKQTAWFLLASNIGYIAFAVGYQIKNHESD